MRKKDRKQKFKQRNFTEESLRTPSPVDSCPGWVSPEEGAGSAFNSPASGLDLKISEILGGIMNDQSVGAEDGTAAENFHLDLDRMEEVPPVEGKDCNESHQVLGNEYDQLPAFSQAFGTGDQDPMSYNSSEYWNDDMNDKWGNPPRGWVNPLDVSKQDNEKNVEGVQMFEENEKINTDLEYNVMWEPTATTEASTGVDICKRYETDVNNSNKGYQEAKRAKIRREFDGELTMVAPNAMRKPDREDTFLKAGNVPQTKLKTYNAGNSSAYEMARGRETASLYAKHPPQVVDLEKIKKSERAALGFGERLETTSKDVLPLNDYHQMEPGFNPVRGPDLSQRVSLPDADQARIITVRPNIVKSMETEGALSSGKIKKEISLLKNPKVK